MKKYFFFINLEERGSYYADVRDANDKTIYEIRIDGSDGDSTIFEDGYMKHTHDIRGLESHLKTLGLIGKDDELVDGEDEMLGIRRRYASGGSIPTSAIESNFRGKFNYVLNNNLEVSKTKKGYSIKSKNGYVTLGRDDYDTPEEAIIETIKNHGSNAGNRIVIEEKKQEISYKDTVMAAHAVLNSYARDRAENNIITPAKIQGYGNVNQKLRTANQNAVDTGKSEDVLKTLRDLEFITNELRMERGVLRKEDADDLHRYIAEAKLFLEKYCKGGIMADGGTFPKSREELKKMLYQRLRVGENYEAVIIEDLSERIEHRYPYFTAQFNRRLTIDEMDTLQRQIEGDGNLLLQHWDFKNTDHPKAIISVENERSYGRGSGGNIPNNYEGKTAEQIWTAWTKAQRSHFLVDHTNKMPESNDPDFISRTIQNSYQELPESIANELFFHVHNVSYAGGGTIPSNPKAFFNSLNMSKLPDHASRMIREDILTDDSLDALAEDDEQFAGIIRQIKEMFPEALPQATTAKADEVVIEEAPAAPAVDFGKRLKLLKMMLSKNPKDETLKKRIKLVEMMAKAKSVPSKAKGGNVDDDTDNMTAADHRKAEQYHKDRADNARQANINTGGVEGSKKSGSIFGEKYIKEQQYHTNLANQHRMLAEEKEKTDKPEGFKHGGTVSKSNTTSTLLLANEFSKQLRAALTKEQMREVIAKNNTTEYKNAEASHDYIDSNEVMDAAFKKVMKRDFIFYDDLHPETELQHEQDLDIVNKAWYIARINDFKIEGFTEWYMKDQGDADIKDEGFKHGGNIPEGKKIQSLQFDKNKFNREQARNWAKGQGFSISKTDDVKKHIRIRLKSPKLFNKASFKTIQLTDGVSATIATPLNNK